MVHERRRHARREGSAQHQTVVEQRLELDGGLVDRLIAVGRVGAVGRMDGKVIRPTWPGPGGTLGFGGSPLALHQ